MGAATNQAGPGGWSSTRGHLRAGLDLQQGLWGWSSNPDPSVQVLFPFADGDLKQSWDLAGLLASQLCKHWVGTSSESGSVTRDSASRVPGAVVTRESEVQVATVGSGSSPGRRLV